MAVVGSAVLGVACAPESEEPQARVEKAFDRDPFRDGDGTKADMDGTTPYDGRGYGTSASSGASGSSSGGSSSGGSSSSSGNASSSGGAPAPTKATIQAILDARCAPCHIGGASAGMSLADDFTTNTVGVDSSQVPGMKRIARGDKGASYLFHKIAGTHVEAGGSGARMPRGGEPLGAEDIARIGAFIDAL